MVAAFLLLLLLLCAFLSFQLLVLYLYCLIPDRNQQLRGYELPIYNYIVNHSKIILFFSKIPTKKSTIYYICFSRRLLLLVFRKISSTPKAKCLIYMRLQLSQNWEAVTGIEGLYPDVLPLSHWCSLDPNVTYAEYIHCNVLFTLNVTFAMEQRSVHTHEEKTLASVGRAVFLGA